MLRCEEPYINGSNLAVQNPFALRKSGKPESMPIPARRDDKAIGFRDQLGCGLNVFAQGMHEWSSSDSRRRWLLVLEPSFNDMALYLLGIFHPTSCFV
jgi:hypothetical protein